MSEFPFNLLVFGLPALFFGVILGVAVSKDYERQAYDDCRRTHNVFVCTYQPVDAGRAALEASDAQ